MSGSSSQGFVCSDAVELSESCEQQWLEEVCAQREIEQRERMVFFEELSSLQSYYLSWGEME